MAENDVCEMRIAAILNATEENNAPECVQEYDTKCKRGACNEESIGASFQSHRTGTDCVCENVNTLEKLKTQKG